MTRHVSHRRLLVWLVPLTLGMFAFGFALVPLYDVLCEVTGLNGKNSIFAPEPRATAIDASRVVLLELVTNVAAGLPWEFKAVTQQVALHPGEPVTLYFQVTNHADTQRVGRAIPSVAPGLAAPHVQKIECFCFSGQTVGPRETRQMPVRLVIAPTLPPEITTLSLSYTFFDHDTKAPGTPLFEKTTPDN